jgi:hypothetical protein
MTYGFAGLPFAFFGLGLAMIPVAFLGLGLVILPKVSKPKNYGMLMKRSTENDGVRMNKAKPDMVCRMKFWN